MAGQGHKLATVNATNFGFEISFDFLALVTRLSTALSSATQYEIPRELGGKRGMEVYVCINGNRLS